MTKKYNNLSYIEICNHILILVCKLECGPQRRHKFIANFTDFLIDFHDETYITCN